MDIIKHAHQILFSDNLAEKLSFPELDNSFVEHSPILIPKVPARSDKHKFSDKKLKFPKRPALINDDKKAQALHFFANHELQAMEMMAAAILMFPTKTLEDHKFKVGIMNTLQDEKRHFLLYVKRMNELGMDFGDLPVSNFFWKQLPKIETPAQYCAFMALTLEAANLDFAKFYAGIFHSIEDFKTSIILNTVYEDEIGHVAIGRKWLNIWKGDVSLWQYFLQNLPEFITPARAKGMIFDEDGRKRAGLDADFISNVDNYRDDFLVTDRKSWK
jgi:uncharacterized ferritin-like protein (DUF455 family)